MVGLCQPLVRNIPLVALQQVQHDVIGRLQILIQVLVFFIVKQGFRNNHADHGFLREHGHGNNGSQGQKSDSHFHGYYVQTAGLICQAQTL